MSTAVREETALLTPAGDPCSGFSFATWSFSSRRCPLGVVHSLENDVAHLSREKRGQASGTDVLVLMVSLSRLPPCYGTQEYIDRAERSFSRPRR
ncbi:hypothetical protein K523DRAFT_94818 [Schizophyllum commune Tattone D]|nr:hypothetical protein K523DRAFT_94818 [Schizophyllum commune Tattone D]